MVVLLWLLHVFYSFLNGNRFGPLLLRFIVFFSKWCTFVGMPVMCSDMFYAWSLLKKHQHWYPLIKGYVVQTTALLCSLDNAESTFS